MRKKLYGLQYQLGRKINFYFLFIPILKIKGRARDNFRLYLLGIPVCKVSTERFHLVMESLITEKNYKKYVKELIDSNSKPSKDFVEITSSSYIFQPEDVKLIAFYLPQFHDIPLNDVNFGKGFTEWTNTAKAIPHFLGHYQPHLPIDTGFYTLRDDHAMYRQIELAKLYGIQGFCFHYYWFSGTRLLEKPLFNFLKNNELQMPFCLCWANENWSMLWDGGNREVIMEHKYLPSDSKNFFYDILPFLKDERYIRIENKPVLIIYRPQLLSAEDCVMFMRTIKDLAKAHGFEGLFLLSVYRSDDRKPSDFGLDAFVEFPPHNMDISPKENLQFVNYKSHIQVLDIEKYIANERYTKNVDFPLFRGLFPSWDNTARKGYSGGVVFHEETPALYKKWLIDCITWTKKYRARNEQFVFINAWNEWAEGAHLEPDQKYGYAYLQATKEALEETQ